MFNVAFLPAIITRFLAIILGDFLSFAKAKPGRIEKLHDIPKAKVNVTELPSIVTELQSNFAKRFANIIRPQPLT